MHVSERYFVDRNPKKSYKSFSVTHIWRFPAYMDLFWFLGSSCCCCVFYGNDLVVAVAVVVVVVLYFEYVHFVVFATDAVHTFFVDCVPTVVEIVVVVAVVVVDDVVVVVVDLR